MYGKAAYRSDHLTAKSSSKGVGKHFTVVRVACPMLRRDVERKKSCIVMPIHKQFLPSE